MNKRIKKILLPYTLITILFMFCYWLTGADVNGDVLREARVNSAFAEIGSHRASLIDYFFYLIGVKSFSGSMWFVGVILWSYLCFLLCKILFKTDSKVAIFFTYSIGILIFGVFAYASESPAHYYRNLWALCLGMALALWQQKLVASNHFKELLYFVILNFVLTIYLIVVKELDYYYCFFVNLGLGAIVCFNFLFKKCTIRSKSLIMHLATLSYVVYLIHGKILTLQWWYQGYSSVTVAIVCTIQMAFIYQVVFKNDSSKNKGVVKTSMDSN